jgi:hypothetical protein
MIMMKQLILAIIPLLFVATIANVYAGGPRHDYPENLEDVPAPECWSDGFDDGAKNDFNEDRDRDCVDKGNLYNRGFDAGIKSCTEENMARSSANEDDCNAARGEEE